MLMHSIPFLKKLLTCLLAGLVVGAAVVRMGVTFLRTWVPIGVLSGTNLLIVVIAIIYAFIWHLRKTNRPGTLAFWQGLIRYGVAYDLACFGWEKIAHLQLVMPLYKFDLPYRSLSESDVFWMFFSHSYIFGCIVAGLQIVGAMLLLFGRTRLVGVFILLPVLGNILLMDIFYDIGVSVIVHASIMMTGVLYFLLIEFDRLKQFFFASKNHLPSLHLSGFSKMAIRLSIIYIPLLLIALHGRADRYPQLTGKYEVKELRMDGKSISRNSCADSVLTVVYFDIRNSCVFEFNTPERRWNGTFTRENDRLKVNWMSPTKPSFSGLMMPAGSGRMVLKGMLGKDSIEAVVQKTHL